MALSRQAKTLDLLTCPENKHSRADARPSILRRSQRLRAGAPRPIGAAQQRLSIMTLLAQHPSQCHGLQTRPSRLDAAKMHKFLAFTKSAACPKIKSRAGWHLSGGLGARQARLPWPREGARTPVCELKKEANIFPLNKPAQTPARRVGDSPDKRTPLKRPCAPASRRAHYEATLHILIQSGAPHTQLPNDGCALHPAGLATPVPLLSSARRLAQRRGDEPVAALGARTGPGAFAPLHDSVPYCNAFASHPGFRKELATPPRDLALRSQ